MIRTFLQKRVEQLSLFNLFKPSFAELLEPSKPVSKISKVSKVSNSPEIRIVVNKRMRQGWRLQWRLVGSPTLTVPPSIQQAPEEILQALKDWTLLAMKRRPDAAVETQRRTLENRVHAWIHQQNEADPRRKIQASKLATRRLQRLQSQGKHHNLGLIFDRINREYFDGKLEAKVTWSARWGGLSTQSIRKDAEGRPYHLLMISRGYDHPSATEEIVGGVVYHECLHIAVPPKENGNRRTVHGREFRKREKEYRHYSVWIKWHREMLPKILRRKPSM